MHSFHFYKNVWSLLIGEKELEFFHKFAIAVYLNDFFRIIIVAHVPINIFRMLVKVLQLPNSFLTSKVTGKLVNRGTSCGLVILVSYICTEHQKTIDWIKKKISEQNTIFFNYWFLTSIIVTFVFNVIATPKITYTYWFIIILFFFMVKTILTISKCL